jgi:antitoxin YqcF
MEVTTTMRAVVSAEKALFGGQFSVTRYLDKNDENSLGIVRCAHSLPHSVASYGTVGLSERLFPKTRSNKGHNVEIIGACKEVYELFPNALYTVAVNVINGVVTCYSGALHPGVVAMYYPELEMKHMLLTTPISWPIPPPPLELPDRTIQWLQAIPLSDAEYRYAEVNGSDALMEMLHKSGVNLTDLRRTSVMSVVQGLCEAKDSGISISEAAYSVEKETRRVFEGDLTYTRFFSPQKRAALDIANRNDFPWREVTSYGTIGLCDHTIGMVADGLPLRIELLGACEARYDRFREIIKACAFAIIEDGASCYPGQIFKGAIEVAYPNLPMKHIMFVPPGTWNQSPRLLKLSNLKVTWLEAIPISEAEMQYAVANSPNMLSNRLVAAKAMVMDLARPSVL